MRNTELMVDKEMKKLMAETGKKRVKAKAVKKVAKQLHLSEDAIWKRIRK
jgi:biotin operon repressor